MNRERMIDACLGIESSISNLTNELNALRAEIENEQTDEPKSTSERFIYLRKCGHHYWLERGTNRVVVSDESADGSLGVGDPRETDDGVLYLHEHRMIGIIHNAGSLSNIQSFVKSGLLMKGCQVVIPLINEKGESSSSPASIDELLYALALVVKADV